MKNKALIIVDPQNDFCSEGGSLANKECIEAVDRIVKWLPEHIEEYERIIVTIDTHYNNYLETREGKHLPVKHCIYHTDGRKIREDLFHILDDYKKVRFNDEMFESEDGFIISVGKDRFAVDWSHYAFYDRFVNRYDQIDICGVCTDICVIANALELQTLVDGEINCLSNLCAGTTPENHEAALKVMKSCQINII